jgi:pimeloyl-ACP methyl ester carboxylesterase
MKPTLLLLPGMDGTGDLFAPFVASLESDQASQVVRYPVEQALGYDSLLPLVEKNLPDGPLVVLGESFSGPLALRLAARHPERVLGLVLCCTFAQFPWRIPRGVTSWASNLPIEKLARWGLRPMLLDSAAPAGSADAMAAAIAKVAPQVLRHRAHEALCADATSSLEAIHMPVLDLRAQHDRMIPARARHLLSARLRQLRTASLAGPHALLQARPKESAELVQAFIRTLVTAAPSPPRAIPPTAPAHRA